MRRLSRAEAHAGACPASGSIAPKGVRAVRRRSLWIRKSLPPVLCEVSNGAFSTGNSFRFIIFASTISDLNRCPAKTICRTAGQPAIRRGGSRSRRARPPHRRTLHVGPFVRVCRFGLRPAPRRTRLRVGVSPGAFQRSAGRLCGGGSIPMTLSRRPRTAWRACAMSFCAGIRIWMSGI